VIGALLALSLAAAPACGLPALAPGDRPWKTGESLAYELSLLGMVQAGTMQLAVERPMSAGRIVPLRARARTSPSLQDVKPFAGVGLSWVDAATLRPERYRDETEEAGVHKTSDARILPGGPHLVIETRYGDTTGKTEYSRERDVLDALSFVYFLRAARLAPGDRVCADLVANRRFWRLEATVAGKHERVETPAGKFDTLRVDAVLRRADHPEAKARPVHIWISTDARRLPVAFVSEIDLGPVSATLTSARGTR
jgi:hypothetical protein